MYYEDKVNTLVERFYNIKQTIKDFYQRIRYGYSSKDSLNVRDFIIRKVYSPLKDFIATYESQGMYLPEEYATDPGAWLIILKKIEYAFDAQHEKLCGLNDMTFALNNAELREHDEKVQEGFQLFGKYMLELFDY